MERGTTTFSHSLCCSDMELTLCCRGPRQHLPASGCGHASHDWVHATVAWRRPVAHALGSLVAPALLVGLAVLLAVALFPAMALYSPPLWLVGSALLIAVIISTCNTVCKESALFAAGVGLQLSSDTLYGGSAKRFVQPARANSVAIVEHIGMAQTRFGLDVVHGTAGCMVAVFPALWPRLVLLQPIYQAVLKLDDDDVDK
eukprot:m.270733 g.270733  ORF g.270733 m.270733 type:complete len:201 (+) comp19317_c0_seq14:366-968(+)